MRQARALGIVIRLIAVMVVVGLPAAAAAWPGGSRPRVFSRRHRDHHHRHQLPPDRRRWREIRGMQTRQPVQLANGGGTFTQTSGNWGTAWTVLSR